MSKTQNLSLRGVMFAQVPLSLTIFALLLSTTQANASALPSASTAQVGDSSDAAKAVISKARPTSDNNSDSKAIVTQQVATVVAASTNSAPTGVFSTAIAQQHPQKLKRDTKSRASELELDTQETGYLPSAYHTADQDYAYDAGKNAYGKQASDWSLYDQGE